MARRSLRPQLNQIRAWVRQGRTDAWIAHQLEVGASELREFVRQHGLSADDDDTGAQDVDLRDEIEAEIEAAAAEEEPEEPADADSEADSEDSDSEDSDSGDSDTEPDGSEAEGRPRRRRRRGRRGGRGGRRNELEATFDHGETDGYGLWLDPAVKDNATYSEHWAGHREVAVTIEADQLVIRRVGGADAEPGGDAETGADAKTGDDAADDE